MFFCTVVIVSAGDIVGVHSYGSEQNSQLTTGIVTHISQSSVRFVVDEGVDDLDTLGDDVQLYLHRLSNDVRFCSHLIIMSVLLWLLHIFRNSSSRYYKSTVKVRLFENVETCGKLDNWKIRYLNFFSNTVLKYIRNKNRI